MANEIDVRNIDAATLAKLLSKAYKRRITEAQIAQIADEGDLRDANGKLDLLRFVAYLLKEGN